MRRSFGSAAHEGQLTATDPKRGHADRALEPTPQILPWLRQEDPARSLAELRAKGKALLAATFPKAPSPSSTSDESMRSEPETRPGPAERMIYSDVVELHRCGPPFWL
eukprot:symbB.v1.2.014943.t1/scaffold1102.1/size137770/9